MGTDYHRATSDSIPLEGENRPVIQRRPPQGHYSPDTGEWDGQLPHTEVLQGTEPDYSEYPGPVARRQWATAVGINFNLSGGERAILQAYTHDAGTPRGCWKSAATMAHELGYNEDFIRDGRKKLIKLGILVDQGRRNRVQRVTLNMNVTGPETRFAQNQTGSHTRLQEDVTGCHTRLHPSSDQTKPGVTPGYEDQTGCHTGFKPGVTPGKHKGTERGEREDINNLSLNFSSYSISPGLTPGFTSQQRTAEEEQVKALVKDNWSLLHETGWDFLGAAVKHFQTYGLEHLQQDLQQREADAQRIRLARRTCVHCHTVHENEDHLEPCWKCEDPICRSSASSCRQHSCYRKHGAGSPDRGGGVGPTDRNRR